MTANPSRMPSHFSCLGFPSPMDSAYQERLVEVALKGEHLPVRNGTYVRWSPGGGVELWLHVLDGNVVGVEPHFIGEAAMEVELTHRIDRPEESSLAGAFRGWANPSTESIEEGDYPLIFDQPDAARFAGLQLPRTTSVQIAAFAHELHCWPDEAAFHFAQRNAALKYATESFVPSGSFISDGESPTSDAMFTGRIISVNTQSNPFSGGVFWWLHVRTLGGEVDVVADPSAVIGEVASGGVVHGSFWLSGRLPSGLADPCSASEGMRILRIWKARRHKRQLAAESTHFGNRTEIVILVVAVWLAVAVLRLITS